MKRGERPKSDGFLATSVADGGNQGHEKKEKREVRSEPYLSFGSISDHVFLQP